MGGSVIVRDGRPSLCMPEPGIGSRPEIEGEGWRRDWNEGFETGRRRELVELLRLMPGGKKALAEHIARYPSFIGQGIVGA